MTAAGMLLSLPAEPVKADSTSPVGHVAGATAGPSAQTRHKVARKKRRSGGTSRVLASAEIETELVRIYGQIAQGNVSEALRLTDQLAASHPNFKLAQLIRGDLLASRAGAIDSLGGGAGVPGDRLKGLRDEALVRLRGYLDKPPENSVPRYLLQLQPEQRTAMVIDTKKSRVYVYENVNGRPRFVADYYFSQGKAGADKWYEGDQKTPIGVYHVLRALPKSRLPDFYGAGALPINYPNEWDKLNGKTGHGIWLHGVPTNTYSRPPLASDGCVVLANPDMEAIYRKIQPGLTPVVISEKVEWLSLDDWNAERNSLNTAIDAWRKDWESLNTNRYLAHYSRRFMADGMNFMQWGQYVKRVNSGKTWTRVAINNISMLRYPGDDDMVVVTFEEEYQSNNYKTVGKIRQYWRKEGADWRIVFEGAATS